MALYDNIGHGYAALRRPDPRIAARIDRALGASASVANIGAGTGSYEPAGRAVVAVEPSEVMIAQRPPGSARCLQGSPEAIPLMDRAVDAAMAVLTLHHWRDAAQGLCEMVRVARARLVLLTWMPDVASFWLTDEYFPEILAHDRTTFPDEAGLTAMIGHAAERGARHAEVRVSPVPVPHDCTDGFLCAYWKRPECYLSAERRAAISSFARFDAGPGLARLRADLDSGRWAERHGDLLGLAELDLGYRLVCVELS